MADSKADTKFVDFSFAKETYAKFRPDYPNELFQEIFKHIEGDRRELAVDIGAGTGQATIPLAKHFKKVIGFDPSPGQMEQTKSVAIGINYLHSSAANLEFIQGNAEKIAVDDGSVDLLISAQAAHWFDLQEFFKEVRRVLRKGGVMAIWCYGVPILNDSKADAYMQEYYWKTLNKSYWDPGRVYIDEEYVNIKPDFSSVQRLKLEMKRTYSHHDYIGYLSTWSGLNNYRKKHPDLPNPLIELSEKIQSVYGDKQIEVNFPLSLIIGKP